MHVLVNSLRTAPEQNQNFIHNGICTLFRKMTSFRSPKTILGFIALGLELRLGLMLELELGLAKLRFRASVEFIDPRRTQV